MYNAYSGRLNRTSFAVLKPYQLEISTPHKEHFLLHGPVLAKIVLYNVPRLGCTPFSPLLLCYCMREMKVRISMFL